MLSAGLWLSEGVVPTLSKEVNAMPEIIVSLADTEIGRYTFDGDEITVGRSEGNDIRINNLSVSRRHAQIRRDGNRYVLIDLDSANGTYVNGARVARTQVFHDDKIAVGKHILRFLAPDISMQKDFSEIEKTIALDKSAWAPTLKVFAPNHRDARVPVAGELVRIGRGRDNEVRLADWFVDKRQAEIRREGSVYRLRNLSGRHTTYLNDEPVEEAFLSEGDIVQAGVSRIVFTLQAAEASPKAAGVAAAEELLRPEAPRASGGPPVAIPLTAKVFEDVAIEDEWEEVAELEPAESAPSGDSEAAEAEEPEEVDLLEEVEAEEEPEEEEILEEESASEVEPFAARGKKREEIEPPELEEETARETVREAAREAAPALSDADRRAVAMWEKALQNKSVAVRKQAAAQLKKLTGRDYAI